jgi:phospholipid/cholesterol/gamma-HCH transport system substrate-binding protein
MQRTTLDLWVGIFVITGVAALFVLALKVGNASSVNMSDGYQVIAEFDNIGGL